MSWWKVQHLVGTTISLSVLVVNAPKYCIFRILLGSLQYTTKIVKCDILYSNFLSWSNLLISFLHRTLWWIPCTDMYVRIIFWTWHQVVSTKNIQVPISPGTLLGMNTHSQCVFCGDTPIWCADSNFHASLLQLSKHGAHIANIFKRFLSCVITVLPCIFNYQLGTAKAVATLY